MAKFFMRDVTVADLETLLTPTLAALGYELWGCVLLRQVRHALIRVYIDKPDGVGVDDCANASHHISGVLAVNDPVKGEYTLEVSSPGLDRPLFKLEQYQRYVGQTLKLKLRLPQDGQRNFQGILETVSGSTLKLLCDGNAVELQFDNIERANVVPDFSRLI